MRINEPDHGSGVKRIFGRPRSYIRILPQAWSGSDKADRHDLLLGDWGGFSWGATRGGVVTYPGTISLPQFEKVHAITKRFSGTGEVWATRTNISGKHNERTFLYGDEVVADWASFLRYALPHMVEGGAKFPFKVKLGIAGLTDLHWPSEAPFDGSPVALDDNFEVEFTLSTTEPDEAFGAILDAWVKLRSVFSVSEPSMSQQQAIKFRLR